MGIKKSQTLFKAAQDLLVGGVNSPVRAFRSVGGTPLFMRRAQGPYLWDEDGNRYVDFVASWGPMILGHRPPAVARAVRRQMKRTFSSGTPNELELEMARLVCSAFPSVRKVRFVSSGTEAVMSAIRLARGATGREKIVKFAGCYHGHSDSLLAKAGSGAMTFSVPDSAGVPRSLTAQTLVLPYNDRESLKACFRKTGERIAAAIVEPVAANMGLVPPEKGFLEELRSLTSAHGALLIFDEVITGFRLAWGGAQTVFGVRPDLTCLGKIIGGGFPVGAFGGRKEIMDRLAPLGPVYQAGTLSGNPVAMAAGTAMLQALRSSQPYARLEKRAQGLIEAVRPRLKARPFRIHRLGSMFTLFFTGSDVRDFVSAKSADPAAYSRFFHRLLRAGIYFPPSQFETCFISTAHRGSDLERTADAIARAFNESGRDA